MGGTSNETQQNHTHALRIFIGNLIHLLQRNTDLFGSLQSCLTDWHCSVQQGLELQVRACKLNYPKWQKAHSATMRLARDRYHDETKFQYDKTGKK